MTSQSVPQIVTDEAALPFAFVMATEPIIEVGDTVEGWWGIGQVYAIRSSGYCIVTLYRMSSGNLITPQHATRRYVHEDEITAVRS